MCILFIALNTHPDYPLVIAANRDEYWARPTENMHWWVNPNLYAGRDLQGGGTWLGVNPAGQIAALTNLRIPSLTRPDAKSRGDLVPTFLSKTWETEALIAYLEQQRHLYNPFNLLFGSLNELFVFHSVSGITQRVENGFHSVSNGAMQEVWFKMNRGNQALQNYINQHPVLHANALQSLMLDSQQAATDQLPHTGIKPEFEQLLSSIFIAPAQLPGGLYGTRSTCILLHHAQQLHISEYVYSAAPPQTMVTPSHCSFSPIN